MIFISAVLLNTVKPIFVRLLIFSDRAEICALVEEAVTLPWNFKFNSIFPLIKTYIHISFENLKLNLG